MNIDLRNLRNWQKDYINNKKRFNVVVVHRRAWKTVWAVLDVIITSMKEEWDYWYIAPTYKQAKKIAWRMLQKYWNQITWFKYNSSELIVNYINWSTISLFWAENPDSLRWLDLKGVIFDEYAQQPSWIYSEIIFPMINANNWWVTWIWTPKWKNAFYKLFERAKKDDRFYTMLLKHKDTWLLTEEQIEDAKKEMSEEEFEQEYNCSFDAFMRWAVYWKELQQAFKDGRVTKWIFNENVQVDTFWDLWISDAMTILFVQVVWSEIRIIDSYKNTWYWLDHYAWIVLNKPYKYKKHYFPHDIQHREVTTWMSRLETAIKLLWNNCDVVPLNSIESWINAGRMIFKHIIINEELEEFINDLSLYQYEYNETRWEFTTTPKHDWTSHYADAFRYLATIYELLIRTPIKEEAQKEIVWNPFDRKDWEQTITFNWTILNFDDDEKEEEFNDNVY
jgi:phage terminase large subunit